MFDKFNECCSVLVFLLELRHQHFQTSIEFVLEVMKKQTARNLLKTFFKTLKIRRPSYHLDKLVVLKWDDEVFSLQKSFV